MTGWRWGAKPRARRLDRPDYGTLVEVALLPGPVEAEMLRDRLAGCGVRATVGPAQDGSTRHHVVLVFPGDEQRARALVGG